VVDGKWTDQDIATYEQIDSQLTEAMLVSERLVSRKFSRTFNWSPKLGSAVNSLHYWKMLLKKHKGGIVSPHKLASLRKRDGLGMSPDHSSCIITIIHNLREARATLKECQQQHVQLREDHLAVARVLDRSPSILSSGRGQELEQRRQREIQRIRLKEAIRRLHRKVGRVIKPSNNHGGLQRVDIPTTSPPFRFGVGTDPTLWEGPWTTVSNPVEIATHICAANATQYHQANGTPFGSDPQLSYSGYKADTPGSEKIISGTSPPPEVLVGLLPETKAIISTLISFAQSKFPPTPEMITQEDFKGL
jgi:hypothetical protein